MHMDRKIDVEQMINYILNNLEMLNEFWYIRSRSVEAKEQVKRFEKIFNDELKILQDELETL